MSYDDKSKLLTDECLKLAHSLAWIANYTGESPADIAIIVPPGLLQALRYYMRPAYVSLGAYESDLVQIGGINFKSKEAL